MSKEKLTWKIEAEVYDSINDLLPEHKKLVESAKEALKTAYAPYSKFNVGAAIMLDNGEIVRGTNQENAAYPSGICAERTAMFWANSQFPKEKMLAIAIVANKEGEVNLTPVGPCGSCRQVMLEYEVNQEELMKVIIQGEGGQFYVFSSAGDLLPLKFSKDSLG